MANNGLGRGLSSLIPKKSQKSSDDSGEEITVFDTGDAVAGSVQDKDKILQVDPDKIKVNPMQPRQSFEGYDMDELVDSIKEYGIIQPLIVTRDNGELFSTKASEDKYELIAGERRLRAAKSIGLKEVPVIIREAREQEKLEVALIENLQRQDLNPIETASAYRRLIDEFNISQEEVAKRVGKSRPSVTNLLRMLNLPEEIKSALIEGRITEGHAKYLAGLDSEEKQLALFKKIVRNGLTVNNTMEEARRMGGTKAARIKINYADKDKEFAFREFFGTKVEIKRKGKGGQIIIDFYSDEELKEIIGKVEK